MSYKHALMEFVQNISFLGLFIAIYVVSFVIGIPLAFIEQKMNIFLQLNYFISGVLGAQSFNPIFWFILILTIWDDDRKMKAMLEEEEEEE